MCVNLPKKECRQHFSKYRKEMLANPTSFRKLKTKRRSPGLLCKWKVVKSFKLALTFGFVHFEALENNTQKLIV
jgi:hypothetical protein